MPKGLVVAAAFLERAVGDRRLLFFFFFFFFFFLLTHGASCDQQLPPFRRAGPRPIPGVDGRLGWWRGGPSAAVFEIFLKIN